MSDQDDTKSQFVTERRQHHRVQDAVALSVVRLGDLPAVQRSVAQPAKKTVRKRDKYELAGYADVRRNYPEVGDYIDALEERIRELLIGGEKAPVKPTHKVSLSSGGLRFSDSLLLQPGDMVGLTLTLFPSGLRIGTDAMILSGNDAPEVARKGEPNYRAKFVRISDADRQSIETHVQQLLGKRSHFLD